MAAHMFIIFRSPDIRGDCLDPDYRGAIRVLSWSHDHEPGAAASTGSAAGSAASPASAVGFSFVKYADDASTELLRHHWSGRSIGSAIFTAFRSDHGRRTDKLLEIAFTGVIVTGFSTGGGEEPGTETVTLRYETVAYSRIPEGTGDARPA